MSTVSFFPHTKRSMVTLDSKGLRTQLWISPAHLPAPLPPCSRASVTQAAPTDYNQSPRTPGETGSTLHASYEQKWADTSVWEKHPPNLPIATWGTDTVLIPTVSVKAKYISPLFGFLWVCLFMIFAPFRFVSLNVSLAFKLLVWMV